MCATRLLPKHVTTAAITLKFHIGNASFRVLKRGAPAGHRTSSLGQLHKHTTQRAWVGAADSIACWLKQPRGGAILTAVLLVKVGRELWMLIQRVFPSPVRLVVVTERLPHGAVALEAAAKSDLPHTIAAAHPPLAFDVGQHIPVGVVHGEAL